MTINEYQRMALRTESNLDEQKLHHKRLLQGLMGLNGEAGECIDVLKKHLVRQGTSGQGTGRRSMVSGDQRGRDWLHAGGNFPDECGEAQESIS